MSHVYKVTIAKSHTVFVEAGSKGEARRHATANIEIERLTSGEAVRLMRAGTAIEQAGENVPPQGEPDHE